ncbi:16 kDa beta-galactoside-binding lectin [Zootoca vivipara]|uniref:16 kDa beta-galactoside-binding lectin n=1 Tax=Zootoca vivipara TaxID=8524 RepID=UPI001590ACCC|nr:16 kDa beta-galactoside-binding lectin [Zootoca vivipara]XP_034968324.1 16 kDa beta-galactoside-binding lectin-like isoform X2 [Zootoca vivipara]
MECGLVATHLKLQHGETVEVKGKILSDCKEFVVNLGQDCDNIALHFNPRFDCKGDVNTIVCNSMENGEWGEEQREADFPFEQDGKVQLSFTFLPGEIKVLLAEGHEISFLNRLGLKTIEYIAVEGDFKIRVLKFC